MKLTPNEIDRLAVELKANIHNPKSREQTLADVTGFIDHCAESRHIEMLFIESASDNDIQHRRVSIELAMYLGYQIGLAEKQKP